MQKLSFQSFPSEYDKPGLLTQGRDSENVCIDFLQISNLNTSHMMELSRSLICLKLCCHEYRDQCLFFFKSDIF